MKLNVAHLREARRYSGFTQKEFADLLGTSVSHYSKVEGGFVMPSVRLLWEIKKSLGDALDLNELFPK